MTADNFAEISRQLPPFLASAVVGAVVGGGAAGGLSDQQSVNI